MIKSLSRIFVIYKPYLGRLILSQVLVLISALAAISVAGLSQQLINEGITAGNERVILASGLKMMVLAIVSGAALAGAAWLAVFFSQGTAYVIRARLYRKIQTFSFGNFDSFRTGNLLVRLNADVINVQNAILYSILLVLYAPFMLVIALILTILQTPELVALMVLIIAVLMVLMWFISPRIFKAYDERQKRLDALNNTLQENLAGVRVVKAFVREDYEIERFDVRADAMQQPAFRAAFLTGFFAPMLTGIAQGGIALSLWIGGPQVIAGTGINLGQLVAFTQFLGLVIAPMAMLAIVVPFALRGDASAGRILEVIDSEPMVQDNDEVQPKVVEDVKGRVVFENVTFAFRRPDGELDPPALKNINMMIEPGQQIGILGATGAGKTAFVNLIPRFYDATEGRITIDGIDVRDFPQDNLRQIVGITLQEALLFQGDVRTNLKFSNREVDDDVMIAAAKAADAYGFIDNLPEKWDAHVSRRGYNFSGGQRQRLSISRTLTGKPRILILDDSTSALDASTEGRVQDAIPQFSDRMTTIYVAQRISAVINLDKIYLMDNGEIIAEGTHEQLLESSPLYQEIYESQLGSGVMAGLEVEVEK